MRGGVSKDGGNASSAGELDHGEPYTGTKLETTDTAKGMHLKSGSVREDNRRAGCPPRGGIRKACGEVPGRNRGEPSNVDTNEFFRGIATLHPEPYSCPCEPAVLGMNSSPFSARMGEGTNPHPTRTGERR